MNYDDLISELKTLTDEKYRSFSARIVNTTLPVYGVRTPVLRAFAKRIKREFPDFTQAFFGREEYSFEEVLLCGWQLGKSASVNVELLTRLIPRFASWAHTDQIIKRFDWVTNADDFLREFAYLKKGGEYEIRAYVMFLFNFFPKLPAERITAELASIPLGAYYVDMAVAWTVCEIITKDYEFGKTLLATLPLTPFVKRKSVSKCHDSYRLTPDQKSELKKLI